jgi:thiosulfate dehydrogenase
MKCRSCVFVILLTVACGNAGCSQSATPETAAPAPAKAGPITPGKPTKSPLVAADLTIVAAAQVPDNPLADAALQTDLSPRADDIRRGFRLFTDTPTEARRFVGGRLSCTNCHLNAGQRDRGLPVVGIAGMFPEYNKRAGRLISLTDRVIDCFLRSENATGKSTRADALPDASAPEVIALEAYLTWLSRGYPIDTNPAWRGKNAIAASAQIPIAKLDANKGEALFNERCAACHGLDGQGIVVGDRRPGPLWGPESWNDGAGAARVYTLAGIIRYTMPYVTPGSLSDEEAQQLAFFINSKPRPAYPFKAHDYPKDAVPADAIYYRPRQP